MNKINELTIKECQAGLKKKEFSSADLTKACFKKIEAVDEKIKAYLTLDQEKALEEAAKIDKSQKAGTDLIGIPYCLKDNFCTDGIRTTASSNILRNFVSPYNATVYQHLEDNKAILLGKTNMDSFAHGSSTETSDFFTTSNPWNTDHLPGGSSGGSAAAVMAQECIFGIGSETAGSIRQPSSWCGTTGLKPTYGRVSRYGVIAMGSSLDSPGPIAKNAEDAAIVYKAIAGHDENDATSSFNPVEDPLSSLTKSIKGLKIGFAKQYFEGVQPVIVEAVKKALKEFEKLGAEIIEVNLFDPQYAIAVYTILQRSEVSSNLARYDGIRMSEDRSYFNDENIRRIMLGTYTLSAGYYDAFYKKAQQVRTLIKNDFDEVFKKIDVIVAPTTPVTALKKGASEESAMFGELMDVLVEPSTIAGLPGLSLPCGFDDQKLPIGMQIIGPQFSEARLLQTGFQYQSQTMWHLKKPEV